MRRSTVTTPLCLPATWINAATVDRLIFEAGPLDDSCFIEIGLPRGCKLLLDALVRLLAFANQLSARGIAVLLNFEEGHAGVMGYLDRMGFFDRLESGVDVSPPRPLYSGASTFRGANSGLLELEAIGGAQNIDALPGRLADKLVQACAARDDADRIGNAAFVIFSELISNVIEHCGCDRDGVAGLQVYRGGNNVQVVVSDSGAGLMRTLRPELSIRDALQARKSDTELLVAMFREGVSRFPDPKRGLGLKACADHAIRFGARLEVRLENQDLRLVPSANGYENSSATARYDLPSLAGTHIAFSFNLT